MLRAFVYQNLCKNFNSRKAKERVVERSKVTLPNTFSESTFFAKVFASKRTVHDSFNNTYMLSSDFCLFFERQQLAMTDIYEFLKLLVKIYIPSHKQN